MDSKKSDKELAQDLAAKALQSGEASFMMALMKAFINTAAMAGYTPQQLAEISTTLSCLLYATAGAPKDEYLKAVGDIYDTAGKLGKAIGLEKKSVEVNSAGGKA